MQTVIEAIAQRVAQHPERDALIAGERRVSYGELWARASAAAREFTACGVVPGDRVLLAAPSVPAFAFGYFGAHLAGAVAVPLDPNAPAPRREELTRRIAPKLVFGESSLLHPELGRQRAIAELEALAPPTGVRFEPPAPDSLSELVFTSGTTSRPKGVRLTHANVAAAASHINAVVGTVEGDVEVVPVPLYHSSGLGRLRCGLCAGATLVLVQGFRLPGEIFTALERHGATGLAGVPAGFAVLLRFGERGLGQFARQLRYVELGTAPMAQEHKHQLMQMLPRTRLHMYYGLTEASRSIFIEFHRDAGCLESAGRPAPGVRVDVRDQAGAACPAGVRGVLWVHGAHVSPGYWDDERLSAASFAGGWMRTGDVAHLDAEGFVHLHGREDDMINVGGFNVSPEEIERVLAQHPAVLEAACIGVPDPRGIAGRVVFAYVVAGGAGRAEDAELAGWIAARLEPYKVPVQYVWVEALPRTASGKLQRAALRREAASAS